MLVSLLVGNAGTLPQCDHRRWLTCPLRHTRPQQAREFRFDDERMCEHCGASSTAVCRGYVSASVEAKEAYGMILNPNAAQVAQTRAGGDWGRVLIY